MSDKRESEANGESFSEWMGEYGSEDADQLVVHGLLRDAARHETASDEARISRVLSGINQLDSNEPLESDESIIRPAKSSTSRLIAVSSIGGLAACVLIALAIFQPASVSAASALESIIETAAQSIDRTFKINVLEEHSRAISQDRANERRSPQFSEDIDGATLYVGGPDKFVFVRKLTDGGMRTSGCDGTESWSFRDRSPVHVSNEVRRRGNIPGKQQSLDFTDLHSLLISLQNGYDIQFGDATSNGSLRLLRGQRKSPSVRGPKSIELQFDQSTGTIHRLTLDGLPRKGVIKKIELVLISQEPAADGFYSHAMHHDDQRKIKYE